MFSGNTARLPLSSSPPTASFSLRGSGIDWAEGATIERSGLPLYQGSPLTIPRFGSTSETSRSGAPSLPSWKRRTGSGGAFSTLCAGGAMTSSEAAEILAETVYAVSQAVRPDHRREPVRNLDSYLYHSFVHRFTRFVGREERIQYVESAESLDFLGASPQQAWVNALENEILLKQILRCHGPEDAPDADSAQRRALVAGSRPAVRHQHAQCRGAVLVRRQEGQGLARGRRRAEKAKAAEEMSSKTTCMPEKRPSREAEEHFLKTPEELLQTAMNAGAIIDQGAPRKRRFLAVQN